MPGLLHGTDFDRQILIEKKAQEAGRLREDPENAEALALAEVVVGKHGKDVCKQPVMTTPYGVTPFGARDKNRDKVSRFGARRRLQKAIATRIATR